MLIEELRDEIISELGLDSSDSTELARVLGCIKSALRRIPTHTRSRSLVTISYCTLSAGDQSLSLPENFITERQAWYLSNGKREEIIKKHADLFNALRTTDGAGPPELFRVVGKTFEVNRPADQDYVIYIEHFKQVWDVELTDTFAGDDRLIEPVKNLSKANYIGDYEEDESRAKRMKSDAAADLDEIDDAFMIEEQGGYIDEAE